MTLVASSLKETHNTYKQYKRLISSKYTSTQQNLHKQDVENAQTPTLIGYLTSPRAFVILTDSTESTT